MGRGSWGLGSGYRFPPRPLGAWRREQGSPASPQAELRSTSPEQTSALRCPPYLSPRLCKPLSSVTPAAAKRTGQAERGRERQRKRGGKATSHLGSHLEPLPLLPQLTTCVDVGRGTQAPGPAGTRRKGGPVSRLRRRDTHSAAMTVRARGAGEGSSPREADVSARYVRSAAAPMKEASGWRWRARVRASRRLPDRW